MASPLAAASAYATVARIASDPNSLSLARLPGAEGSGDTSFASVLKDAISSVSETEVAIDAVVAVRDRVIQAYEDIMKMPI